MKRLIAVFLFLALTSPSFAALGANTVFNVQTGGNDTSNSGGFDPGQTAGMFTDLACTSATGNAPVCTSASYNFVAGDANAWLYVASGTNWTPGWYKISSVASNAATVNATIAAAIIATRNANTVAGIATTASPTAGTWTIDYSQGTAAQFSYTDLASAGTGLTVSSAAFPFAKQQVGNCLIIASGTNFNAGVYCIASVAATVATVVGAGNVTTGAGASGVGGQGGAFVSPGKAASIKVAGNDVCILNGTYSLTSATPNIAGGMISDTTGGVDPTNASHWIGYSSLCTLGNLGTKPLLQASGAITSFTILNATNGHTDFQNLSVDCATKATSTGLNLTSSYEKAFNIKAANCTVFGVKRTDSLNSALIYNIEATGMTSAATAGIYIGTGAIGAYLEAHGNATCGIQFAAAATAIRSLSYANTGATTDGFCGTSVGYSVFESIAYGNGRAGFDLTGNAGFGGIFANNIAEANAGVGYRTDGVKEGVLGQNNTAYNNNGTTALSGQYSTAQLPSWFGYVANTTGTFFVNAASGNFALNSTTNQGALARAAGYPATYAAGTTANSLDIGVAQHADPAGSSVTVGVPIIQ